MQCHTLCSRLCKYLDVSRLYGVHPYFQRKTRHQRTDHSNHGGDPSTRESARAVDDESLLRSREPHMFLHSYVLFFYARKRISITSRSRSIFRAASLAYICRMNIRESQRAKFRRGVSSRFVADGRREPARGERSERGKRMNHALSPIRGCAKSSLGRILARFIGSLAELTSGRED